VIVLDSDDLVVVLVLKVRSDAAQAPPKLALKGCGLVLRPVVPKIPLRRRGGLGGVPRRGVRPCKERLLASPT